MLFNIYTRFYSLQADKLLINTARAYSQALSKPDKILTETVRAYSRAISEPDKLLIETAQAYSNAKNISGRFDTVLASVSRADKLSCA